MSKIVMNKAKLAELISLLSPEELEWVKSQSDANALNELMGAGHSQPAELMDLEIPADLLALKNSAQNEESSNLWFSEHVRSLMNDIILDLVREQKEA